MPRTSDVDLYRHLIAGQRHGSPRVVAGAAVAEAAVADREAAVVPATTPAEAAVGGRFAEVVGAIARADADLSAGDTPLVVRVVVFDDGGPADAAASRWRFPGALAVLVILGDLDDACARRGVAGYARLLVRAGAAAQAGRAAAKAAGYGARLDHTAGRATAADRSPLTPLCTVVLREHGAAPILQEHGGAP
jgi:hypothetical protein